MPTIFQEDVERRRPLVKLGVYVPHNVLVGQLLVHVQLLIKDGKGG